MTVYVHLFLRRVVSQLTKFSATFSCAHPSSSLSPTHVLIDGCLHRSSNQEREQRDPYQSPQPSASREQNARVSPAVSNDCGGRSCRAESPNHPSFPQLHILAVRSGLRGRFRVLGAQTSLRMIFQVFIHQSAALI